MDGWEDAQIINPTAPQTNLDDDWKDAQIVNPTQNDDWSDATVINPSPTPKELKTKDVLSNPIMMSTIRQYMVDRNGVQWEKRPDQDLLDSYMTHQRFVSTNEIDTAGEALYISRADEAKKTNALNAYKIYEDIAPFWSNGDAGSAITDYAASILTSPSTWLGGFVGKGVSAVVAGGARKAIMETAISAARTEGIDAAKKVLAAGAKAKIATTVGTAAAVDTGISTAQDIIYQSTLQDMGAQDDYSLGQTALVAATGALGGGISLGWELKAAANKINPQKLRADKAARTAAASQVASERIKRSVTKLTENLNKLKADHTTDWATMVEGGMRSNPNLQQLVDNTAWFFDVNDPDSFLRIVVDSGAHLDLSEGSRFTEQVVDFVKGLPAKDLDEINNTIEPTLGVKLGQLVDIIAAGQSKGGQMLQQAKAAKDYAREYANMAAGIRQIDKNILDGIKASLAEPSKEVEDPQYLQYIGSLWRRALVSHPGTTATNVAGWGIAATAKSLAQLTEGGLRAVSGDSKAAKALFQNQAYKAKILMDPYGTRESFMTLLSIAPKKIADRTLAEFFGGIGNVATPERYGIPQNMLVRGAEKGLDVAGSLTLIKAQDIFTKSVSGLSELDLQARKAYGVGIEKLFEKGEYYKITDDMWSATLKSLLEDTMSMDYTKGTGGLAKAAEIVEKISNHPVLGFAFPFGKFMNNTVAFSMQYSPVGMFPMVAEGLRKGSLKGYKGDIATETSKAIVGTVGLGMLIADQMGKQEEGMQWYEGERSDGTLINTQNLAPIGLYEVVGRALSHVANDEAIPKELYPQIADQLGAWAWIKDVGQGTPLGDVLSYATRDDNPELQANAIDSILAAVGEYGGQIASGFTRPLDPINRVVGIATGTDAAIDKRMEKGAVDKTAIQLIKYTDNIFDALLGEQVGTTLRSASRPEGDIKDPNPISGLAGQKQVTPKNYTDKLLGMVDMPAYLLDQRTGIPEADRFMNENIAPLLNAKAKSLLNDDRFQASSISLKRDRVKMLLKNTRNEIRDKLESGYIGAPEDRAAEARKQFLAQPQALRDNARKQLGISASDRDLTIEEINALRYYMSLENDLSKYMTQ